MPPAAQAIILTEITESERYFPYFVATLLIGLRLPMTPEKSNLTEQSYPW
jgi:hypothetical protein